MMTSRSKLNMNFHEKIAELKGLQIMHNAMVTPPKYTLINQDSMLSLADELSRFIKERNLCCPIQNKQYVYVEGWQFAGAALGLSPVIESLEDLSNGSIYKYRASVAIKDLNDRTITRGIAICSNKENKKKSFDEYAVASMAQTRAIGKGYRNLLAWVMKAAGFEATPAEEMEYENNVINVEKEVKKEVQEQSMHPMQKVLTRMQEAFNITENQILHVFQKDCIENMSKDDWEQLIEMGTHFRRHREDSTFNLNEREAFLLGMIGPN